MQVRIKQYSDIEARYGSHEQRDLITNFLIEPIDD